MEEMECLLDFMYRGSIDVAEEHLPSLIKTATDLEIRGLSGEQKNQESNRNLYTRVETRMQRCHIETRVHTTEYIKEPSVIPFLPKHSTVDSIEDHIKVEDIEVEDDPMVIDGHEDSFDELPRSTETQIVSSAAFSFVLLPPRFYLSFALDFDPPQYGESFSINSRGNCVSLDVNVSMTSRDVYHHQCTSEKLDSKGKKGYL